MYPTMAEISPKGTRGPPFAQYCAPGTVHALSGSTVAAAQHGSPYLISPEVYSRQAEYYPHS